ncbi:MAG TPA: transcriptional regulator [Armatimonadota bacterium]|nr:transcriptional regulator [Armatimonadota bacterium]
MPVRDFQSFLTRHPVFTVSEIDGYLGAWGGLRSDRRKRLLAYHKARGNLVAVRSGLYAVVPPGFNADSFVVDSFLIAARLTPDSVLAYHTALEFHGVAQSTWRERIVVSSHVATRPIRFQGITYRTAAPPGELVEERLTDLGIVRTERMGVMLRVTGRERTLVDVLDRSRLGGDWEEVWRSFEGVPYLDLDLVVRYALALNNATTIARVGYFLTAKKTEWMVDERCLEPLRANRPRRPHYAQRDRRESARLVAEWNILVPESALTRSWEEENEPLA